MKKMLPLVTKMIQNRTCEMRLSMQLAKVKTTTTTTTAATTTNNFDHKYVSKHFIQQNASMVCIFRKMSNRVDPPPRFPNWARYLHNRYLDKHLFSNQTINETNVTSGQQNKKQEKTPTARTPTKQTQLKCNCRELNKAVHKHNTNPLQNLTLQKISETGGATGHISAGKRKSISFQLPLGRQTANT